MPNPEITSITAPAPLRGLPAWLVWKYEQPEGGGKPRKVPYYANGGRRRGVQGGPEDRRQLTTFEVAKAAAARRGFDGVGFATLAEWGVCALDFDGCIRDDRVLPAVLQVCEGTYTETSPSSTGVRAIVRGAFGNNKDNSPDQPFGLEVFSTAGFVTVTGRALDIVRLNGDEDTIAEASPALRALCAQRFGGLADAAAEGVDKPPMGLTEFQIRECLDVLPKDLHYDDWLRVGMALHHETGGEGFHLWDEWGSTSHKYTDSAYGKGRWDSFGRSSGRTVTAHWLVRLANRHGAHVDLSANAADDFDVIAEVPGAPAKPSRFTPMPDSEFMGRPAPEWIVKGLVPKAELLVLFGESGAGKSFIALDLFAAVARGVPWRGLRVRPQRVVYVAAEGAGGFRNRLVAYAQQNGGAPGLRVIHAAPNLLQRDEAVEVHKAIASAGGADVVVIDTLAQTTPGANENAAEDMGKALSHCKGISRALGGALVVLVHHAGKDTSKGARGWSGLKAAADAEIEVIKTAAGRVMRTSKQKDGEDGQQWGFELTEVPIGLDDDGDVITSCVVGEAPVPAVHSAIAGRKLGAVQALVDAVVQEMAVAQSAGIERDAVVDETAARMPAPTSGSMRDTRRQRASRALRELLDMDDSPYVEGDDGCLEVLR